MMVPTVNTFDRQRGASPLGWLIVIVMVCIIGLAGLKLLPVYLEYYSLADVLETMRTDSKMKGATKREIVNMFYKRVSGSSIESVRDENVVFKKVQGKKSYLIEVNYKVKTPLFGNLSLLAEFNRSAEVGG